MCDIVTVSCVKFHIIACAISYQIYNHLTLKPKTLLVGDYKYDIALVRHVIMYKYN